MSKEENTNALYTCRVILGANGSGKTSLEQQYIDAADAVGRPCFIMDPNDQFPDRNDTHHDIATLADEVWKLRHKWSGLIVLDDADLYLKNTAHQNSVWLDLFISFRHWQCDILVVSRRPQEIPKIVQDVSEEVALFKIRGAKGRKAIYEWFDNGEDLAPPIMRQIPTVPFHYFLVNADTLEGKLYQTQRRETKTAADEK